MKLADETFAITGVGTWSYSSRGTNPVTLIAQGTQTSKTFAVPKQSSAAVIRFTLHELVQSLPSVKVRIQDTYLNLGSFSQAQVEAGKDGSFGDIRASLVGVTATKNQVVLSIPSNWYSSGRLTAAFPAGVGIETFSIDAVCSSTVAPSQAPTAIPSASPTVNCIPDVIYEPSIPQAYNFEPIAILKQEGQNVTFTVSQTWDEDKVCLIATDYVSAKDSAPTCDPRDNVPAGEFAMYTAKCVNGYAVISMFVQDSIFPASASVPSIPARCSPIASSQPNTISYKVTIPCVIDSQDCVAYEPASCASGGALAVISEGEVAENDSSWLHGAAGLTKTFNVPSNSDKLTVTFTLRELTDVPTLMVRVQDHYLRLGSFAKNAIQPSKSGYMGDIAASLVGTSLTDNDVTLVIKSSWYTGGRLSLGFPAGVELVHLAISADCSPASVTPQGLSAPASPGMIRSQDWTYPGFPARKLASSAVPAFSDVRNLKGTVTCKGLAESANKPRIAMSESGIVYYVVQDQDKLTTLKLQHGEWSYLGGNRYVKYDVSRLASGSVDVKVQASVDYQNFDIQARGSEVCILWSDASKLANAGVPNAVRTPLVYCYTETSKKWTEIGFGRRIGMEAEVGGDVELLLPSGSNCPGLGSYYYAIVGSAGAAHLNTASVQGRSVVWYYNSLEAEAGWRPLGGDSTRAAVIPGSSKDAQLAIPSQGAFKCTPHAVVADVDGSYENTNKNHLVFSRFQPGAASATDPQGYIGGQWVPLASLATATSYPNNSPANTIKASVNDFVFTDSGIPAVGWVDGANNNFAYLSVWKSYPTAAASARNGFEIAGRDMGKNGSIPPVYSSTILDKPAYNIPEGMTIDAHRDAVFVAITDNGVAGSSNAGKKVHISYINLASTSDAKSAVWTEYETNMNQLLPQSQDTASCSDSLTRNTNGDAQNHLKIAPNGDIYVAHIIAKETGAKTIASLAKNGLPSGLAAGTTRARRDEEALEMSAEPEVASGDGSYYCSAVDFPCDSQGMVHVCHYSARLGYQTFCIPEADSEVLRFYKNDYCGPCVGGYGGINTE
jgi:hypothetical protein